jgi:hypothetical protein
VDWTRRRFDTNTAVAVDGHPYRTVACQHTRENRKVDRDSWWVPSPHHVMSSTNVLYSKHTPRPKSSFHLDLGGLTGRAWSSGLLASAEKRECAPWSVPPPATWTHGIDSNRICGVVQLACRRCTAESSALRLMYARRTMLSVLSLAGVPLVLRSPSSVSSFDLPMLPAGIRIWCTDVWVNRCVESGVRCGNVCRTCLRHSWTQTWCPRP